MNYSNTVFETKLNRNRPSAFIEWIEWQGGVLLSLFKAYGDNFKVCKWYTNKVFLPD